MVQITSTDGYVKVTHTSGRVDTFRKGSFYLRRDNGGLDFYFMPNGSNTAPLCRFSYTGGNHTLVDTGYPEHASADELESQLLAIMSETGVHSPHRDAFGRIRISPPKTLWGNKMLFDNSSLFWSEETNGTGSASFVAGSSRVDMSVSADEDYAIRQSRQRLNYQSGKSQRVEITGTMGAHVASTQKRIGYFNSATTGTFSTGLDGIWFESDGTTLYCVIYNNGTEVIKVAQADWNIDKMDDLDLTKAQIFFIDFEWLGVGGVRFGFIIDQDIRYCHHYAHANKVDNIFMRSPNHSIRYEIRSTGGTATIKHICSAVTSEGGEDITGLPRCASTGTTHADLTSATTIYPLVGIRLQSTKLDQSVVLNTLSVLSEAVADFRVLILLNPIYTGGTPSWANVANSALQSFTQTGTPSITIADDDWELNMREIFGTNAIASASALESSIRIGAAIDGTQDELVIAVMPLGANADLNVALNWIEI